MPGDLPPDGIAGDTMPAEVEVGDPTPPEDATTEALSAWRRVGKLLWHRVVGALVFVATGIVLDVPPGIWLCLGSAGWALQRSIVRLYVDTAAPDGSRRRVWWTVVCEPVVAGLFGVAALLVVGHTRAGALLILVAGVLLVSGDAFEASERKRAVGAGSFSNGEPQPSRLGAAIERLLPRGESDGRVVGLRRRFERRQVELDSAHLDGDLTLSTRFLQTTYLGARLAQFSDYLAVKGAGPVDAIQARTARPTSTKASPVVLAILTMSLLVGALMIVAPQTGDDGLRSALVATWPFDHEPQGDKEDDSAGAASPTDDDLGDASSTSTSSASTVPIDQGATTTTTAPTTTTTVSFEQECGSASTRPGEGTASGPHVPDDVAKSFDDLYFTIEPRPGARELGCPRPVEYCSDRFAEVYFQRAYRPGDPEALQGLAIVPVGDGAPFIVLSPRAEPVWDLLHSGQCVTGTAGRYRVGVGDIQLIYSRTGTTMLVRRELDKPVSILEPAATEALVEAIGYEGRWLWPLKQGSTFALQPDSLSALPAGSLEPGPPARVILEDRSWTVTGSGRLITIDELLQLGVPGER